MKFYRSDLLPLWPGFKAGEDYWCAGKCDLRGDKRIAKAGEGNLGKKGKNSSKE